MLPNDAIQTTDGKQVYMQYLEEARQLRKEYLRVYRPYMWIGLVFLVLSGASCYAGLFAPTSLGATGVKITSWLYWLGLIAATVIILIGNSNAKKIVKEEVDKVTLTKRGFADFFKLYLNRRYWPDELVTGEKYSQFLSIIGRSETS